MSTTYDESVLKDFGRNWTPSDWERVEDVIRAAGPDARTQYYLGGFWQEHQVRNAADQHIASIMKGRVKIWDETMPVTAPTTRDEKDVLVVLLSTARHGDAPSATRERPVTTCDECGTALAASGTRNCFC